MAAALLLLALGLVSASLDNVDLMPGYTVNWNTPKDTPDSSFATIPLMPLAANATQIKFRVAINAAVPDFNPTGVLTWNQNAYPYANQYLLNSTGGWSGLFNISQAYYYIGLYAQCGNACVKTLELELAAYLFDSNNQPLPVQLVDQRRTAKFQMATDGSNPQTVNFWFVVESTDLVNGYLSLYFTVDLWASKDSKIAFAVNKFSDGFPTAGNSTSNPENWAYPPLALSPEGGIKNYNPNAPFLLKEGVYLASVYLRQRIADSLEIPAPSYTGITVKLGYNQQPSSIAGTTKPMFFLVAVLIVLLAFH